MKKILSLIVVLALCLSILPGALAESAADAEYDIPGNYVTFDAAGLKFWLPDVLTPYALSQEAQTEGGYLGYYVNSDKTAALGVTLILFENTQITIDDVAQRLRAAGVSKLTDITIHELPCLAYSNEVEGGVCKVVTVLAGKGRVVEFAFMGVESAVYDTVTASIQPAE